MPEREKILLVVREWVARAENDLMAAVHTLKLGEGCPTDTVCFHAQQCVEKYLKAVLVRELVDFPKSNGRGGKISRPLSHLGRGPRGEGVFAASWVTRSSAPRRDLHARRARHPAVALGALQDEIALDEIAVVGAVLLGDHAVYLQRMTGTDQAAEGGAEPLEGGAGEGLGDQPREQRHAEVAGDDLSRQTLLARRLVAHEAAAGHPCGLCVRLHLLAAERQVERAELVADVDVFEPHRLAHGAYRNIIF